MALATTFLISGIVEKLYPAKRPKSVADDFFCERKIKSWDNATF